MTYQDMLRRAVLVGMGIGVVGVCGYGVIDAVGWHTLTHNAVLAAFVVGIPALAIATAAIVWVAVAIRTRLGRTARPAEAGTERVSEHSLAATGPGVVTRLEATPGPASTTCDCSAYPWLDGRHDVWCKADPIDIALDGPGTGDLAQLDYLEAWRQAGCPAVWPIPVVHGRTEGEQS